MKPNVLKFKSNIKDLVEEQKKTGYCEYGCIQCIVLTIY